MVYRILNRTLDRWKEWYESYRFLFNPRKPLGIPLSAIGTFAIGLSLTFVVAACSASTPVASNSPSAAPAKNDATAKASVVRFGYQKSSILLKSKGVIEKRLEPSGVKAEWTEFPAGPQMLEALNVGAIDIGNVGESPPIFAQAAGADLVYVAAIASSPKGSAILVQEDSPIQSVAGLKGKKVAFQKGSSANYLTVQLLEKAGLQFTDIKPVYLPPADARAAFAKKEVDAWVIWDPFYAAAEIGLKARALADGEEVTKQGGYFIARRKFVRENPQTLKGILEEIRDFEAWSDGHRDEVAKALAPVLKLDLAVANRATQRRKFGLGPVTENLIAEQQKVADAYYRLKLIPKQIDIRDVTLKPDEYATFALK